MRRSSPRRECPRRLRQVRTPRGAERWNCSRCRGSDETGLRAHVRAGSQGAGTGGTLGRMSEAPLPEHVEKFRTEYRRTELGTHYFGWAHFAFTSLGCLSVIGFSVSQLSGVRPLEWLMVPASFLLANVAEYFGHR